MDNFVNAGLAKVREAVGRLERDILTVMGWCLLSKGSLTSNCPTWCLFTGDGGETLRRMIKAHEGLYASVHPLTGETMIHHAGPEILVTGANNLLLVDERSRLVPASQMIRAFLPEQSDWERRRVGRVIYDDTAGNTVEQAKNLVEFLADGRDGPVALWTSDYHAVRSFLTVIAALDREHGPMMHHPMVLPVPVEPRQFHLTQPNQWLGGNLSRWQLWDPESTGRILEYQAKGDVAAWERAAELITFWSDQAQRV